MATPLSQQTDSPLFHVFVQAPTLDEPASKLLSPGIQLPFDTLRLIIAAAQKGLKPPHLVH